MNIFLKYFRDESSKLKKSIYRASLRMTYAECSLGVSRDASLKIGGILVFPYCLINIYDALRNWTLISPY